MSKIKTRKGFSLVAIIILLLVLAGLGVGGYYAYNNYVKPILNPYAKLIPEGLNEYAKGADADGFIVIRKDAELEKILRAYPFLPAMVYDFQSGLILVKSSSQTAVAVLQFSNSTSAKALSDLITPQTQQSSLKINLDQKDKYLIASYGGNLDSFTGSLLDNPNVKKLDTTLLDSQIIVGLDIMKMQEASTIPFSIINSSMSGIENSGLSTSILSSAHAQGLISPTDAPSKISEVTGSQGSAQQLALTSMNYLIGYSKNCFIYLRLKNDNLTGKITVNFMAKNEIASSPLVKKMLNTGTSTPGADLEKAYDEAIKNFKDNLPELQKQADEMQKQIPGSSAKVTFNDTTLEMSVDAPLSELQKLATQATSAAPMRARDAARKANLNMITLALETYNSEKNIYPATTGCVDKIDDIQTYFKDGKSPTDPNGTQFFGPANCESGYYYQSYGSNGYVLWAKMENDMDGNTTKTPEEYLAMTQSGQTPPREGSGTYFVINETYPTTVTAISQETNQPTSITSSPSQETSQQTSITSSTPAVKKVKRSTQ
jgi:type II secretory pathway pseudopilin PulG